MQPADLKNTGIVILNYNNARLTRQAAEHLLQAQSGLQIIIVDNDSKDDSEEFLRSAFADTQDVHLVFNSTNLGYAHGNNVGIRYAKELGYIEYIGIMNPDVVLDADVAGKLAGVLKNHDEIGLVTTEVYYNGAYNIPNDCAWRAAGLLRLAYFCTSFGYISVHFLTKLGFQANTHNFYYPEHYADKKLAYADVVQGCFFMARLSTLLEIGLLDEHTFLYFEEDILAAKIRRAGKRNAVLLGSFIQHNHQSKESSLVKRANKIFDITCLHESRDYYIRAYTDYNPLIKFFLRSFLEIDFQLRKLGVRLVYKE